MVAEEAKPDRHADELERALAHPETRRHLLGLLRALLGMKQPKPEKPDDG
jgi:hypothetical protein